MSKLEKQQIVALSRQLMDERIAEFEAQCKALQEGVANESKSSAGDKHETSRAMMNLEQEKLSRQLQELLVMKDRFEKIDFETSADKIKIGSLIQTNKGLFLLSVGLGKISMDGHDVLLLSKQSPLGEALYGKCKGEKIGLNANQYIIDWVS